MLLFENNHDTRYETDDDPSVRCENADEWTIMDKGKEEVADSVSEFPYACAIQYRQIRGRTLLPGSEWDRV